MELIIRLGALISVFLGGIFLLGQTTNSGEEILVVIAMFVLGGGALGAYESQNI